MKRIGAFFVSSYPLIFLSALLSAIPLTFPSLFLLSWFSFAPFFLVLVKREEGRSFLSALLKGTFFGFCYHFFIYFWFLWLYPLDFAGFDEGTSLFIVLLAWLGISFAHGLSYSIPTLLCHVASKWIKNRGFLLFTAIFGVLIAQHLTSLSELAFPWVRVSLGNYRAPVLIQSVSLFGTTGLDFLMLSISALIAYILIAEGKKKKLLFASFAAFLFTANLLFGVFRLHMAPKGESLAVSSVQGCVLSGEKWDGMSAVDTYVSLTEQVKGSELVVWPESATASNLYWNEDLLEEFQSLSRQINTPILMGCFWEMGGGTSNSAVLLDASSVSAPYSKRHLVPFGEKMPYSETLSKLLPILDEMNLLSSDLAEGKGSGLIDLEKGKAGVIICFESLFPSLTRQSVRDGAEVIILVTNDSWYKDSPGVWQHLAHAVFRSVENSRSTVRCANSGVSAMIDERGRITEELGPLQKGVLSGCVSLSEEDTLYTLTGDIFLPLLSLVYFFHFSVLFIWERRKKNA